MTKPAPPEVMEHATSGLQQLVAVNQRRLADVALLIGLCADLVRALPSETHPLYARGTEVVTAVMLGVIADSKALEEAALALQTALAGLRGETLQ